MRRTAHAAVLAVGLVLALAAAAFAQTTEQRAAQIRAGLERAGLRVLEVAHQPAKEGAPPIWAAITAAGYAQPTGDRLLNQALRMWSVMHEVVARDGPDTVQLTGQVWTKYTLILFTQTRHLTTLASQLRAATNDAERQRAGDAFLRTVRFRVFDLERQQYVDEKDFINKNFSDT